MILYNYCISLYCDELVGLKKSTSLTLSSEGATYLFPPFHNLSIQKAVNRHLEASHGLDDQ